MHLFNDEVIALAECWYGSPNKEEGYTAFCRTLYDYREIWCFLINPNLNLGFDRFRMFVQIFEKCILENISQDNLPEHIKEYNLLHNNDYFRFNFISNLYNAIFYAKHINFSISPEEFARQICKNRISMKQWTL